MDQDKLAAIIAKAGDKGRTTLNLSGKGLSSLPPEIGNLTALKVLDLVNNELKELPSWIGNLTSLEMLDLSYNHLTELPPG